MDSYDDADGLSKTFDTLTKRQRELEKGANSFATAMTGAFARSVTSGRSFDDTLKSMALRLSDLSVRMAMKPIANSISGGLQSLFSGLFGGVTENALGAVKPFASGGVINTPSYFPLSQGGMGLAGEAGPEAIMPLARGPDGKLGVAASGGTANITIQISTPDADSFRRSEAYLTGQIARAVARGQRSL